MATGLYKLNRFKYYLLLAIVAIFALGANPFKGETVAPMDLLLNQTGWKAQQNSISILHPERSDILVAYLPIWMLIKEKIYSGQLPLWLHERSGGLIGIQNLAWGTLTPAYLAFLLVKSDPLGFYLAGLVKLVTAGIGMFLFLRLFLQGAPSFFGGCVFMLAGFNAAWFFWPQVSTSCMIPWVLWATTKYIHEDQTKALFAIIISSALMILGGFPSVAVYGFISMGLLLLIYNGATYSNIKTFGLKTILPLGAVAISFILVFVFLYVLYEYLSQMNLGNRTGTTCFQLRDFKLFIDPYFPRVEKTLYCGLIALLLSIFAIAQYFFNNNRIDTNKTFIKYALILFTVSTIIVFGLIHHDLIRMIPTFGFNPWQRMNIIISLAITILASYGLQILLEVEWLKNIRKPLIYNGLIVIILLLQILDQKILFNSFNGAVSTETFFPKTPTIEFVKNNITGMQNVIADHTYMISGSLTAYGLPEWFAQNLKSTEEQDILGRMVQQPFVNPFAATFDSTQINFDSPYLSALGTKFILSKDRSHNVILEQPNHSHDSAPPMPANHWSQHVVLSDNTDISAIELLLATYGEETAPADVLLSLKHKGQTIATSLVTKDNVQDNRWIAFPFKKSLPLQAGRYAIELELINYQGDKQLTVWTSDKPINRDSFLSINGDRTNRSMKYKVLSKNKNMLKNYEIYKFEDNISVYVNKKTMKGPYFIPNLSVKSEDIDLGDILLTSLTTTKISLKYEGEQAGWIVLPMRFYPGWKAYINGEKEMVDTYLDMLPAIPINGASEITYKYSPGYLKWGGVVVLFGILISIFYVKFASNRLLSL